MHTAIEPLMLGKWGSKTKLHDSLSARRHRKDSHLKEHFGAFPSTRNMFHVIQTLSRFLSQKLLHYLSKHVNQRLQLAIYSNDAGFNIYRARFQWEIVFLFTSLLLEHFFLKGFYIRALKGEYLCYNQNKSLKLWALFIGLLSSSI